MPTSTRTKLQVGNSVLTSCGERSVTALSGTLGTMVNDSIREALQEISTSAAWTSLKVIEPADSWSADTATLESEVYRVNGVYWYSSPDGTPEATYDYGRLAVEFTSLEHYLKYQLTPYTDNQNRPRYWTIAGHNQVRVNPYPNDTTERGKISFEVYKQVTLPSTDANYFNCTDMMLTAVQYKASALFAIKFLSDFNLAQALDAQAERLRRKLLVSDTGVPTRGYTLFPDGRL